MKTTIRGLIFVLCAVCGTMFLSIGAEARMDMAEREHVQAIVRLGEFLSFVSAVLVFLFVWYLGKRDKKNKDKSKRSESDKP